MSHRTPHRRIGDAPDIRGGRATALDQAELVRTALTIVNAVGVEGLTMRILAERLNVSVAAAYRHVAGKPSLLRLAADELFSRIVEGDPADEDWLSRIRALMIDFYDVMISFPGMSAYIALQSDEIPKRRMTDTMREILGGAGFSAAEAWDIMTTFVFYCAGALDGPMGTMDLGEHKSRLLREAYQRGLDTILDGISVALERKGQGGQMSKAVSGAGDG